MKTLNFDVVVIGGGAAGRRPRAQHHWPGKQGPVPLPQAPAKVTHAINGGVFISPSAQSSVEGIYAGGQTAAGAHGGDRLGGNMLPNSQVFGRRAGIHSTDRARQPHPEIRAETLVPPLERLRRFRSMKGKGRAKDMKLELQEINARTLYVVRTDKRLARLEGEIQRLRDELPRIDTSQPRQLWGALETDNMLTVSQMMGVAARLRTESRGSHFRSDHPLRNDEKWQEVIFQHLEDGEIRLRTAKLT